MVTTEFWYSVIEGYQQVETNHTREVAIKRDGKEAAIFWDDETKLIVIEIESANTAHKEPLIAP